MINARRTLVNSQEEAIIDSRIQINVKFSLPQKVRVAASRPERRGGVRLLLGGPLWTKDYFKDSSPAPRCQSWPRVHLWAVSKSEGLPWSLLESGITSMERYS